MKSTDWIASLGHRSARLAVLLMGCAVLAGAASTSFAQCDAAAPVLVDLDFTPQTVDVSGGDQFVTVTFDLVDDVSGVERVGVNFLSPTANQNVECTSVIPTSGTPTNGTYQCVVTVPRYAEAGTWLLSQSTATDEVGRSGAVFTNDLIGMGLPFSLQVISVPDDTEAPQLTGLAITPVAVDVSLSTQQIACDATATDNLAGISVMFCSILSPVDEQRTGCVALTPSSGSTTNGTYSCVMDVPQYSEAGTWAVEVQIGDVVENTASYLTADLISLGLPTAVTITSSPEDMAPPFLTDFDMTPLEVNVEDADRIVTCSAQLTDLLSGTATFGCTGAFLSPTFEVVTQACSATAPISGNPNDGLWSCDLTIPQYSPGGTWTFVTAFFGDRIGNSDVADSTALGLAGFPNEFDVICGSAGPGPGPTILWTNDSLLSWSPVAEAIQYNLYGASLSFLADGDGNGLPDAGYGMCRNGEDSSTIDTTFLDITVPPPGTANFILVGYDTLTLSDQGLGATSGMQERFTFFSCP